jgi:chromate transporter
VPGAIAAFAGLLGPPVVIVTILAILYARFGDIEALRRTLAGVSCAAVGLLFAVIFRMMLPLLKKREPVSLALLIAVFVAVGVMRWPLPTVLLVSIPVSIGLTMLMRRRAAA